MRKLFISVCHYALVDGSLESRTSCCKEYHAWQVYRGCFRLLMYHSNHHHVFFGVHPATFYSLEGLTVYIECGQYIVEAIFLHIWISTAVDTNYSSTMRCYACTSSVRPQVGRPHSNSLPSLANQVMLYCSCDSLMPRANRWEHKNICITFVQRRPNVVQHCRPTNVI